MKPYSHKLPPCAAGARISIYAKKLTIDIVSAAAGGIKSPDHPKLNPMGRLTALETEDGAGDMLEEMMEGLRTWLD